ncbi:MAG: hypothetical protein WCA00_15450 [Candidatus Acidiferrales bacterium]
MERFVTVNDFSGSKAGPGPFDGEQAEAQGLDFFETAGDGADSEDVGTGLGSLKGPNQGPCLYLGPKGQRCGNPAVAGGFCARHQPDAPKAATRGVPRVVAAGIGILAAMWPVLADLLREVLRWIHSH